MRSRRAIRTVLLVVVALAMTACVNLQCAAGQDISQNFSGTDSVIAVIALLIVLVLAVAVMVGGGGGLGSGGG